MEADVRRWLLLVRQLLLLNFVRDPHIQVLLIINNGHDRNNKVDHALLLFHHSDHFHFGLVDLQLLRMVVGGSRDLFQDDIHVIMFVLGQPIHLIHRFRQHSNLDVASRLAITVNGLFDLIESEFTFFIALNAFILQVPFN